MKRKHKILITLLAVAVTVSLTTVPAFALTESEVQDQVPETSSCGFCVRLPF